jgi:hypothetical protein
MDEETRRTFVARPLGKCPHGRPKIKLEDTIKKALREVRFMIEMTQDQDQRLYFTLSVSNVRVSTAERLI